MKNLVLLRGLPGSGKTTLATDLFSAMFPLAQSTYGPVTVAHYSADMYFEELGRFDASKLKDAHAMCQGRVRVSMEAKCGWIFVHNTFTREWEMSAYFDLAEQHGYKCHVVTVENWHGGKSEPEVPFPKVEQMAERFEIRLYDPTIKESLYDVIQRLYGVEQSPKWHPEGNVGIHTELVLGQTLVKYPSLIILHAAALFHDIGKLHTTHYDTDKDKYTAYGHENVSADYVTSYADDIIRILYDKDETVSSFEVGSVQWLVKNHMRIKFLDKMREGKIEKLKAHVLFPLLQKLNECDRMSHLFETETEEAIASYRDAAQNFIHKYVRGL